MKRALVIAGLAVCAALQFEYYPGHSYLQGESQVFAPMIERLQFPGLLSRDIVAAHPVLRYTAYDEITLAVERLGRATIEISLGIQLLIARLAGIGGMFLIARACGLQLGWAAAVAALGGLGLALPLLHVGTAGNEPTPFALALGWIVLATGQAARGRVFAAGVAGGVGFLYSPVIALPWWLCFGGTALLQKQAWRLLKPIGTAFSVAILLLANLVQLQPGAPGGSLAFQTMPGEWRNLIEARTPQVVVQTWIAHEGWLTLAIAVSALVALYRLRAAVRPAVRQFFALLIVLGMGSVLVYWAAQTVWPLVLFFQVEPARLAAPVLLPVCFALLAGAALQRSTGLRAAERLAWSSLALSLVLASAAGEAHNGRRYSKESISALSQWAQRSTWGGSMFVFAGIGKATDAGMFRTLALRPVYIDWQSGELSKQYQDFAVEWRRRWNQVNVQQTAAGLIRALSEEPIDYFVLSRKDKVAGTAPVFATNELIVYDAREVQAVFRGKR